MKTFLGAFLIAIIVGGLALAGTVHFGVVHASTDVIGIISSDTTWTKANSPYSLTGRTAIAEGVTLTIEAGATINLKNYYIQVNGTLRARGSNADPIYFNGKNGDIRFSPSSSDWNEQSGSGCIIENAIFEAGIVISSSPKITNNTLNGVAVMGGSPIISKNIFIGSWNAIYVGRGLGNAYIIDNVISDCGFVGISVSSENLGMVTIERNLIINGGTGIFVGGKATIRSNAIAYNNIGIEVSSPSATIIYNNIQDNNGNMVSASADNVDATYNWWGTTDASTISKKIYDNKNDFNLGTVNFVPFLTTPNTEAPPIPTSSTPTPTPTQPPSPSPSPSQNQTASPDQSNTQPTPQNGLYLHAIIAVLIAVIIALLIAVAVLIRKQRQQPRIPNKNTTTYFLTKSNFL